MMVVRRANPADDMLVKVFLFFFQKTGFDMMQMETICMKYQNLFSGKNKIFFNMSFDENFTQSAKR